MDKGLLFQACGKFAVGLLLVAALLFLPAGTVNYWQAWLLIVILFVPMFGAGIVLLLKNPTLLQKRMNTKEEQTEQKWVVALTSLMFLAAFVAAGLNVRFGWFLLPAWVSCLAAGIFLLGYALYAAVLMENVYLSRTVEVQEGQKVIDTGLYAVVRHPMYLATLLLFFTMPLVLGSILSFIIMLAYIPIIVKRIQNEEEVLELGLEGYVDYKARVKYRLIPYIW